MATWVRMTITRNKGFSNVDDTSCGFHENNMPIRDTCTLGTKTGAMHFRKTCSPWCMVPVFAEALTALTTLKDSNDWNLFWPNPSPSKT